MTVRPNPRLRRVPMSMARLRVQVARSEEQIARTLDDVRKTCRVTLGEYWAAQSGRAPDPTGAPTAPASSPTVLTPVQTCPMPDCGFMVAGDVDYTDPAYDPADPAFSPDPIGDHLRDEHADVDATRSVAIDGQVDAALAATARAAGDEPAVTEVAPLALRTVGPYKHTPFYDGSCMILGPDNEAIATTKAPKAAFTVVDALNAAYHRGLLDGGVR